MARRVSIEIVGDSASVERAFKRASVSATGFTRSTNIVERDFSRMTRGVLSGSGVLSRLGRSLAFASGGFLAFGTASELVRGSIDAAETSEKALKSLGAQARASGSSVKAVFADIGKLQTPALSLGFNKADVEAGFTVLLRGSGSAKKALSEMAAAEDVARAKGLSLSQGATLVNRALISTGNSARSLGIHFPKAATAAQKLQIILQRFAGQARANTTETDKFNATLFNTEVIVGSTLLPILNKYLASLGAWLTKMDQSGRLQQDVNTVVKDGSTILHDAGTVIHTVDSVTGSFKNTLEDLAAVWVVLKARMLAIRWGLIATEIAEVGAASKAAAVGVTALGAAEKGAAVSGVVARIAEYTGGIEAAGVAADAATARTVALTAALTKLKAIGTIGLVITEAVVLKRIADAVFSTPKTFNLPGRSGPQTIRGIKGLAGSNIEPAFPVQGRKFSRTEPPIQRGTDSPSRFAPKISPQVAAQLKATGLRGQFNLDELKLAQAQVSGDTAAQRKILVAEAVILKSLALQAKTLKDRTSITQQLAGVEDQIRGIDASNLSAAKRAKDAAAKAAKKAAAFNVPLPLQIDQARLEALGKPIVGILNRIKASAEKALKSGKLGLQGQLDAWNEIASVNDQLKNQTANALGSFREVNTKKLASGLGLAAADFRKLRARLSQLGPGGHIPNQGVGAFGVAIGASGQQIVIHHTTKLDGKTIEKSVTRHQQKRQRRNSSQSRGPFAGVG